MNDEPKQVSVCAVIVHHRGERLLARCLDSLMASERVDLRVVIVSNACREPLPRIVSVDPRVHVVRSERSIGFSEANNLGARFERTHLGSSKFLFFVNNDTILRADTVWRLCEGLARNPKAAIAGPMLEIWGANGVLNSLGLNVTRSGEAWDEGIGLPVEDYPQGTRGGSVLAVTGAALMVRREPFDHLGGWEEFYGFYFEDIDLCLRARSHGMDVLLVEESVMSHAISATAARGSDMKLQLSWRNRFLLMMAHWPWPLLIKVGLRMAMGELRLAWRRARARAWGASFASGQVVAWRCQAVAGGSWVSNETRSRQQLGTDAQRAG